MKVIKEILDWLIVVQFSLDEKKGLRNANDGVIFTPEKQPFWCSYNSILFEHTHNPLIFFESHQ